MCMAQKYNSHSKEIEIIVNLNMIPFSYQCPYCWEKINSQIDARNGSDAFIEDCIVCCNPLEFHYEIEAETLISLEVRIIQ